MRTFTVAFAASPRTVASRVGAASLRVFGGLTLAEGITRRAGALRLVRMARKNGIVASVVTA